MAKDGELGYATAAQHVDDTRLATIFAGYVKERAGFVKALQDETERLGGVQPPNGGTLSGAVFRGWMNLKSAVTGGGPGAIVAACETGEDCAAAAYERVVNLDVTGQTRTLIESQWRKIREAHHRMIHLKAVPPGQESSL